MLSYNLITRQTFYSLGLSVSFSFIAAVCFYDHKSDIFIFLFQNDDVPLSEQTVAQVKTMSQLKIRISFGQISCP